MKGKIMQINIDFDNIKAKARKAKETVLQNDVEIFLALMAVGVVGTLGVSTKVLLDQRKNQLQLAQDLVHAARNLSDAAYSLEGLSYNVSDIAYSLRSVKVIPSQ